MDPSVLAAGLGEWSAGPGQLYQRLAQALRRAIHKGHFGAGALLPAERDLARTLGISRTTVVNAYRQLREQGWVTSVRGSGTRVTAGARSIGPTIAAVVVSSSKLVEGPEPDCIDLTTSVVAGADDLPEDALAFGADELRQLAAESQYQPLGLPELRTAIADRYTDLGLPTTAAEIIVTTGGQQGLNLVLGLLGRNRQTIVTESPTYAGGLDAARTAGATLLGVPVDRHGCHTRTLRSVFARSAPDALYLMGTCHNPTGAVLSDARAAEIGELTRQRATVVVDDETLADLVFDRDRRRPLAATLGGNVVTVGSLSKVFWPGLRVGWMRVPQYLVPPLAQLKVVADLGSAQLSQRLALRLLPILDRTAACRRAQLTRRRDLLCRLLGEKLPEWSWSMPAGGMSLFVRLPGVDGDVFAKAAITGGVRVLPGRQASVDGDLTDYVRLSFAAEEDALRAAVDRLALAWSTLNVHGAPRGTAHAG